MTMLQALEREFRGCLAAYDAPSADDHQVTTRRVGELITAINTTPPATIADCCVKLRLLADPELGIDAGDRDDDAGSLRQVIAFLEQVQPAQRFTGLPKPPSRLAVLRSWQALVSACRLFQS